MYNIKIFTPDTYSTGRTPLHKNLSKTQINKNSLQEDTALPEGSTVTEQQSKNHGKASVTSGILRNVYDANEPPIGDFEEDMEIDSEIGGYPAESAVEMLDVSQAVGSLAIREKQGPKNVNTHKDTMIKEEPESEVDSEVEEMTVLGSSHARAVTYIARQQNTVMLDNPRGGWEPVARDGFEPERFFGPQQYNESNRGCTFIIADRDNPLKSDSRFANPKDERGVHADRRLDVHWVSFSGHRRVLCDMASRPLKTEVAIAAYLKSMEKSAINAVRTSIDPNLSSDEPFRISHMDPREFSVEERRYINFDEAVGAYISGDPLKWPKMVAMGGSYGPLDMIKQSHSKLYGERSLYYQAGFTRYLGIPTDKKLTKEEFLSNIKKSLYKTEEIAISPFGNPRFKWQACNSSFIISYSAKIHPSHNNFDELRQRHSSTPTSRAPLTITPDPQNSDRIILSRRNNEVGSLDTTSPLWKWAQQELENQKDVSFNEELLGGVIIKGQMGISDPARNFYVEPVGLIVMDHKKLIGIKQTMEKRLGKELDSFQFFLLYENEYLEKMQKMQPIWSNHTLKREASPRDALSSSVPALAAVAQMPSSDISVVTQSAADIVESASKMTRKDVRNYFVDILSGKRPSDLRGHVLRWQGKQRREGAISNELVPDFDAAAVAVANAVVILQGVKQMTIDKGANRLRDVLADKPDLERPIEKLLNNASPDDDLEIFKPIFDNLVKARNETAQPLSSQTSVTGDLVAISPDITSFSNTDMGGTTVSSPRGDANPQRLRETDSQSRLIAGLQPRALQTNTRQKRKAEDAAIAARRDTSGASIKRHRGGRPAAR